MKEKKCKKCKNELLTDMSKRKNLCASCRNWKDYEREREKKWQGFYEKAAKIKDSWARKITMINLQRGHKLFLKTGFIEYRL